MIKQAGEANTKKETPADYAPVRNQTAPVLHMVKIKS